MISELEDLREHLERFRAVTIQVIDIVSDAELSWAPDENSFSCGQQLLHIAQAEDFYARGLLENDWEMERLRLPKVTGSREELPDFFSRVRQHTLSLLPGIHPAAMGDICAVPGAPIPMTLGSWLWFIVEHEIHHKAQLSIYLRQMGHVAPFYAMPLPLGHPPDFKARQDLGGF